MTNIEVWIKQDDQIGSLRLDDLPVIPRVGDIVSWSEKGNDGDYLVTEVEWRLSPRRSGHSPGVTLHLARQPDPEEPDEG